MSVAGPGRRGVLVATPDPVQARHDREWLEGAGIPAALPADLGLKLKRAVLAQAGPDDQPSAVAAWAIALRRPALQSLPGHGVSVAAATGEERRGRAEAADVVRAALDEPLSARVAVFGGAWVTEDEPEYTEALRLGRALADKGVEVVTGGYQGIMAAASRGASQRNGPAVVGITIEPWSRRVPVNRWLSFEVEARDLFARLPVICDADAWVAFPGGVGTLSEIALCWNLVQTESVEPRPLIIVGERWDRALRQFRELLIAEDAHFGLVRPAEDADEALNLLGLT